MDNELLVVEESESPGEVERLGADGFEVGQWYWMTDKGETYLGIIDHIGSNYLSFQSVGCEYGRSWRIGFNECFDVLTPEVKPMAVIHANADTCQKTIELRLEEIRTLAISLGLQDLVKIGHTSHQPPATSQEQALWPSPVKRT